MSYLFHNKFINVIHLAQISCEEFFIFLYFLLAPVPPFYMVDTAAKIVLSLKNVLKNRSDYSPE